MTVIEIFNLIPMNSQNTVWEVLCTVDYNNSRYSAMEETNINKQSKERIDKLINNRIMQHIPDGTFLTMHHNCKSVQGRLLSLHPP
jgi:HKD family nuclease